MKAQDLETKKKFLVSFLRAFLKEPFGSSQIRERTRLPIFHKETLP